MRLTRVHVDAELQTGRRLTVEGSAGNHIARVLRLRAGDSLTREEMNQLIDHLFATRLPHGDPHGRTTYVRVDLHELNQRFGRSD